MNAPRFDPDQSAPLIGWPLNTPPLTHGTESGITWATAPSPLRWSINGYAQIPAEHPWATCENYADLDVEVHGGLTFGAMPADVPIPDDLPEELREGAARIADSLRAIAKTMDDVAGWVGFDTAHAWDHWTDDELTRHGITPNPHRMMLPTGHELDRWWTLEQVEDEARHLARQIAAAKRVTA